MQFDVVVIGAGAAGMMCAAQAGQRGRRVLLIDHVEKLGERIRISGGGRCNFTNRRVSADNYLSHNPHFCRSALARYTPQDFIALVQRHRIAHHEREHGELFCDESAQDIIDMLKSECERGRVQWMMPCTVQRVERTEASFNVVTARGTVHCASLVIATGGLAVPQLGATPFGYRIAEQFGLRIVPPKPALVPLALAPETLQAMKPLAGVSVDASAACDGSRYAKSTQFRENILVTHRGLSGPAVLQISSYWQMQDYDAKHAKQPIEIDLVPDIDAAAWLAEHRHDKRRLANVLGAHLPQRFAHEWCALGGWEKPVNEMSNRDLDAVTQALKRWTLMPSGTLGYAKAEVTLGGVDTDVLSSKTMEAKAVAGLYFIGEVVDVTGWLGGYNFQWAWSSGWVAGQFV